MLTLYQFQCSHYCEKARWAFDYKGLAYETRNLVSGTHRLNEWPYQGASASERVRLLYFDPLTLTSPEGEGTPRFIQVVLYDIGCVRNYLG